MTGVNTKLILTMIKNHSTKSLQMSHKWWRHRTQKKQVLDFESKLKDQFGKLKITQK